MPLFYNIPIFQIAGKHSYPNKENVNDNNKIYLGRLIMDA